MTHSLSTCGNRCWLPLDAQEGPPRIFELQSGDNGLAR